MRKETAGKQEGARRRTKSIDQHIFCFKKIILFRQNEKMGAINRRGGETKQKKLQSSNKKTNEISLRKKPIVPPKAKGKFEYSEGKFADDDSSNSCQTESDEEYHSDSEDEDDSSSNEDSTSEKGEVKGYSDENAVWLKPKQNKKEQQVLLSSSGSSSSGSDDEEVDDDEVYDEDEGEEEVMMDIERKSKIIDEEMELERLEAEEEMRQVIATQTSVFHLPTPEELEMDKDRVRHKSKNNDIRCFMHIFCVHVSNMHMQ